MLGFETSQIPISDLLAERKRPWFPFVGVIEHTNFDTSDEYGGDHIVYLSRYLPVQDPLWSYSEERYFENAKSYLKKMFPSFEDDWVVEYKIWRSEHAQPITEKIILKTFLHTVLLLRMEN